jgi:general stress protein 26
MQDIADAMREIDFTMLSTMTAEGTIAARPMSNNRDVDYDGDSWFFAMEDTDVVREILAHPQVGLTLHGNRSLLGKPPMFIAAAGAASIIRDRALLKDHWNSDLERWFADGAETPGLVLIKVQADHLHYWDGEDQGEVSL